MGVKRLFFKQKAEPGDNTRPGFCRVGKN